MISETSQKLNLCYYSTLQNPIIFENDPISKLIYNYSDILSIIQSEKDEIMKFLYFNKSSINKILYKTEEEIKIEHLKNIKLSELFYLSFLIMDSKELVNYLYPINLLYEISNFQRSNNKEFLKKIILSKIVILLVYNYRESNLFKFQEMNELEILEEDNEEKIKECKLDKNNNLKPLYLGSIKNYEIYDFYTKIIVDIIKSKAFENNEMKSIYNVIKELELDTIYITKDIYDELFNLLNVNEKRIKKYMILNKNDLSDEKKINFYYFLLKYIFKNSFYIYQIPLFLNTRKIIINLIIKNNFNQLFLCGVNDYKDKIEYVIRALTDSEYYYKKYIDFDVEPLKTVLFYYKNFLFESKKEDINIIEKIIETKQINTNKNYLKDLVIARKMNNIFPVIKYIYDLKRIKEKIQKNEEGMKKCVEGWAKIEIMIKSGKFKKMIKSMKKALINYFKDINNKAILLKIFEIDTYFNFIEKNIDFLNFDNYLIDLNNISDLYNDNESISKKTKNEKLIENEIIYFIKQKIIKTNFSYTLINKLDENENNLLNINKKVSESKVLELVKIIDQFDYPVEFIKELSNGFFICGTGGGKNKNALYVYNQSCVKIIEINGLDEVINNVYEINENKKKDIIQIIICLNKLAYNIYLNIKENNIYVELYNTTSCKIFLEIEDNNSIIAGEKGAIYSNLFKNDGTNLYSNILLNISINGGIRINDNIAALISKNMANGGEDKLILYDCKKNNIIKQIEGYSYTESSNGLCVISMDEKIINNKVLLCACKKNITEKKNGILLINVVNFEEKEYFYDLDNFEVNCFCPILIDDNQKSKKGNETKKDIISINNVDYFFVGGFDIEKNKGAIKLFKLIYNDENEKIKFIQDIFIENYSNCKGIESPISCIIQSKLTGKILITSNDGKIYLFYPPNIEHYLYDSKIKNKHQLKAFSILKKYKHKFE
jgi:hypothetical protein